MSTYLFLVSNMHKHHLWVELPYKGHSEGQHSSPHLRAGSKKHCEGVEAAEPHLCGTAKPSSATECSLPALSVKACAFRLWKLLGAT